MKIYYIVRYERQYDNIDRVMYDPNDNRIVIYLLCVRSNITVAIRAELVIRRACHNYFIIHVCRGKKRIAFIRVSSMFRAVHYRSV